MLTRNSEVISIRLNGSPPKSIQNVSVKFSMANSILVRIGSLQFLLDMPLESAYLIRKMSQNWLTVHSIRLFYCAYTHVSAY
jgi:hypothetical protein